MKSADLIRELRAAGWVLDRVRGSHHVFRHPGRPGHVVVPHPKKDTAWTPEIARQAKVARQVASEAADWAIAAASAGRYVATQWNAREAHYTTAEDAVANALRKITG